VQEFGSRIDNPYPSYVTGQNKAQMPIAADIYYHEYKKGDEGQRPPVILLHGAGGTHLYWPVEIRRLAGYHVFALDLPGHGKSVGRGQQSIAGYAAAIKAWLDELHLHRTVFIGHSMGSAVTLTLALDYPDQVIGLGILGGAPRLRVAADILENSASSTTFHNAIEMIVARSFSPQAPQRLVELAGQRMLEIRPSVLHGDMLACDLFDESERIGNIQQPTLVLCGAEDQMTPLRQSQFLATTLGKAQLVTIPEAGHMVMLEKPVEVATYIGAFLDEIPYL
jgi:pimeloyl-ACP methyl ester carboxylesterase